MAKLAMKTLELHYLMIQFLIKVSIISSLSTTLHIGKLSYGNKIRADSRDQR